MKPFTSCPGCGGKLYDWKYSESWYSQGCNDRCELDFHQNMSNSFQDELLTYFQFSTEHFNLYVYIDTGYYTNISHIYSKAEMKERGTAMPIIKMPSDQIDIHKRVELDKRLQTLALFT